MGVWWSQMETRAEINLPVYVCELKPGNALALSQNFFFEIGSNKQEKNHANLSI